MLESSIDILKHQYVQAENKIKDLCRERDQANGQIEYWTKVLNDYAEAIKILEANRKPAE